MNRLLAFLNRRPVRWTGRILSVSVIVYAWYSLATAYDLSELDSSPGFRYGIIFTFTCFYAVISLASYLENRPVKRPLAVDPDNPPMRLVYIQGSGEEDRCACHGEVIEDGAEILYWPQPAKLVCVEEGDAG